MTDLDLVDRPSWHADAACRGTHPDDWFPVEADGRPPYVELCAACPVHALCAEAGRGQPGGWWGGQPVGLDAARAARKARP